MAIPNSFLDELVGRTDITELVGGYVQLTKRGGGNMFGLCPFHSEKTPSFSVSVDKQIYHCFGCGKGGGAINFIMEIENLPFRDAVEFLARRAGMTVPDDSAPDELAGKRKRMLEINRDAARFFHEMLMSESSVYAKKYLAERGISPKMAKTFGLGAVPDAWSSLLDAMTAKGYSRQELIEAGLARKGKKEGAAYDLFRNRLIFPVIDIRGSVIGFSGRILGDGEPKYLNSPDTLVFNKSRNLFALNLAKKSKAGMLILAEGNIDVIALHQAGFDCAVASLGTALTAEQVRLMSRYADNAVIAYDSDEAGRKAALRAIDMFEKTKMGVKVIDFGDSKDPDEFLKNHGIDAFERLLERSENHIEYRLMTVKNRSDLASDEGRLKFLTETTKLLSELGSKPEREVYGARVAKIAGVSPESVENEVAKMLRINRAQRRRQHEKQIIRPAQNLQPVDRTLRYKNEYSAAAEEGIIRCLVRDPMLLKVAEEMGLAAEEFTSEFLAKVFTVLNRRGARGEETGAALLMAELEGNEASQLTVILQKPEAIPNGEKSIRAYIERIRTEKLKSGNPDEQLLLSIKKYRERKDVGGG
ncbi:MAG: DNA primase [Oscillospiraceae bacterium]|nr:DNA primase [Oscillospiraceae bacterium]